MNRHIIRKLEGKGERITLPVSLETKKRWEEIQNALTKIGFEIDTDQAVRRIIRSLDAALNPGHPKRKAVGSEGGK